MGWAEVINDSEGSDWSEWIAQRLASRTINEKDGRRERNEEGARERERDFLQCDQARVDGSH